MGRSKGNPQNIPVLKPPAGRVMGPKKIRPRYILLGSRGQTKNTPAQQPSSHIVYGPQTKAQADPNTSNPLSPNYPTSTNITSSLPMEIKRKEDSQYGAPLGHLDLGNDEPKVPTAGNLSTFRSDVIVNDQGVDNAFNASGVSYGKTSQLPSLNILHSIYPEENMSGYSKESNYELLKLQRNNYHNNSSIPESSTNFLVRSMPIQPNCAPAPRMGRETRYRSHSGPSVPCQLAMVSLNHGLQTFGSTSGWPPYSKISTQLTRRS
ncbi:hypothetical protein FXO37_14730 [Capsicum annuum]|nr:hypothetical protein FXO37_14730 [Capsicum annuum]